MGRKKNQENLSNEAPKVQEKLLEELVKPEKKFEKGAKCRIKANVSTDITGKKIMWSIRRYTYTIKAVRPDNHCTIECLTYVFTLPNEDLDLV